MCKREILFLTITNAEKVYGKNYYISDGKTTLNDIAYALSDNIHPLIVTVERNGELIDLKTIYPNKDGIIGFEKNYKEAEDSLQFSVAKKQDIGYNISKFFDKE